MSAVFGLTFGVRFKQAFYSWSVLCMVLVYSPWGYGNRFCNPDSGCDSAKRYVYPKDFFVWPVKGEIDLTGNFGEIRNNHFHSGLDIRTGKGQTGIPVYASGDGYVSRINESSKGYGKAVYIEHPNGFTSVYGHLMEFAGEMATYVNRQHYVLQKSEMECYPGSGLLRIKKGQLIAYSGNTGGSAGPHLHFEIRDTRTSEAINPLLFGLSLTDKSKPFIKSVTLYHLKGPVRTETGTYLQKQFRREGSSLHKKQLFVKPGVYALGADWTDHLHNGGFRMGIPYAELRVNRQTVFTHCIERLPFEVWRMVNCHIDYPMFEFNDLRIIKLFRDDGNTLDFYPQSVNRGKILVESGKSYSIQLKIRDFEGHEDEIRFVLTASGEKSADDPVQQINKPLPEGAVQQIFYPDRNNELQIINAYGTLNITVPKGVLYDTVRFYAAHAGMGRQQPSWEIGGRGIPLHDSVILRFTPQQLAGIPQSYALLRITSSGAKKYEPGRWTGTVFETRTKTLGTFVLEMDTLAPSVTDFSFANGSFRATVKDDVSGIRDLKVYCGETWVLSEYDPKTHTLSGTLPEGIINAANLRILLIDYCHNRSEVLKTISR